MKLNKILVLEFDGCRRGVLYRVGEVLLVGLRCIKTRLFFLFFGCRFLESSVRGFREGNDLRRTRSRWGNKFISIFGVFGYF